MFCGVRGEEPVVLVQQFSLPGQYNLPFINY